MLLRILNKKISTEIGIVIILSVAVFFGWIMIKEYKELMEMRFAPLEIMGRYEE